MVCVPGLATTTLYRTVVQLNWVLPVFWYWSVALTVTVVVPAVVGVPVISSAWRG